MNGKIKRLLVLSVILILSVSAVCILSSCKKKELYYHVIQILDNGDEIRQDVRPEDVGSFSLYREDSYNGYVFLEAYSESGEMLFDENGEMCDPGVIRELFERNKTENGESSITVYRKTEEIVYSFACYWSNKDYTTEYDPEPQRSDETVLQVCNATLKELIENTAGCFPKLWGRNGYHFSGWSLYYNDMEYESFQLRWREDHYEDNKMNTDLASLMRESKMYFSKGRDSYPEEKKDQPNSKKGFHYYPRYDTGEKEVYTYSDPDSDSCEIRRWGSIDINGREFADYQPETTRKFEHSFFAWSKSRTEYIPFDGTVTGDMKLFRREIGYKTIVLEPMNGDSSAEITIYDDERKDLPQGWELSVPYGYTFGGWYKTRDCEGEPISLEELPKFSEAEHGATYYAKWIKE